MNEQLESLVRQVVDLLVCREYSKLETLTRGVRLGAADMANAIGHYGRTLVSPPKDAFESTDVIEVRSVQPRRWSPRVPLWTQEERRSDLSVELTLIGGEKTFTIELDDIHVP